MAGARIIGLRRTLGLWDLILYGIIIIQPVAPMPSFGIVSDAARGHVVTAILIAMVAMLITAISYGRMARVYPSAGAAVFALGRALWQETYIQDPLKVFTQEIFQSLNAGMPWAPPNGSRWRAMTHEVWVEGLSAR